jgi:MIP family channel proteins
MPALGDGTRDVEGGARVKTIWQQGIAEFFGTLALVFIAAGSVVVSGAVGGVVGVAIAQGLVLAIMVTNLGHISGAHFNPAVTVGVWVAGKIETVRAGWYVVFQLAGAAAGAGLLRLSIPERIWRGTFLGATTVSHQVTTSGRAVLLEAVLTFFLVFTVFATAIDDRGAFKSIAGFGIGLVLAFDILVGGPLTGGSMNPARTFGPALVAGHWTDFWVYVAGPLSGGIIAAAVYWLSFLRDREVYAPREEVPIGGGPEEDLPGREGPDVGGTPDEGLPG